VFLYVSPPAFLPRAGFITTSLAPTLTVRVGVFFATGCIFGIRARFHVPFVDFEENTMV